MHGVGKVLFLEQLYYHLRESQAGFVGGDFSSPTVEISLVMACRCQALSVYNQGHPGG
jgi:hypothetical protein